MLNLLGEYDCKLDSKGRFMFPAGLKKQLGKQVKDGFVVNRDIFESCLVLYPTAEWEREASHLRKLNRFVRKNVLFLRRFTNGATPTGLDGSGRMLLPKTLMLDAGLKKEMKVVGIGDRIELWSKESYDKFLKQKVDFGKLAEEVMGDKENEQE